MRGPEVPFFIEKMVDKAYIEGLVEEKTEGSDIFLVEVKITPGKITVLADKPTGILINECIAINRFITEKLEPSGMLDSYELEVSSPGLDQPLKVYNQYLRRIGREVRVVTKDGTLLEGRLSSAMPEGIEIIKKTTHKINKKKETTEEHITLPFETIKETKLILTF
jgi:ribosome maturation factor RimP